MTIDEYVRNVLLVLRNGGGAVQAATELIRLAFINEWPKKDQPEQPKDTP